jgi:DNA-binding response OmpR family regulator
MSKILLVEDDQFISRVYERAFRLGGHEIEILGEGESAWARLLVMDPLPSVVILDLVLPQLSGIDLLAKINGDKRFDHTPVAVLTNSFDQDLEKKLLASGADLYLIKVDNEPKDVVARIEELIQKIH